MKSIDTSTSSINYNLGVIGAFEEDEMKEHVKFIFPNINNTNIALQCLYC